MSEKDSKSFDTRGDLAFDLVATFGPAAPENRIRVLTLEEQFDRWTHLICDPCWIEHHGRRQPTRVVDAVSNRCCFCGTTTTSGIFVREDGKIIACRGRHEKGG